MGASPALRRLEWHVIVKTVNVTLVSALIALAKIKRRMTMEIAKGPGGVYWMVKDENGEVVSTHATKAEAEKAATSTPTTYQNKMATAEKSA